MNTHDLNPGDRLGVGAYHGMEWKGRIGRVLAITANAIAVQVDEVTYRFTPNGLCTVTKGVALIQLTDEIERIEGERLRALATSKACSRLLECIAKCKIDGKYAVTAGKRSEMLVLVKGIPTFK